MATRELNSSPSMAALFARAGAAMIPGASQLPFVGGGGRDVPELTLRLTDVEVDAGRVADYDRVCGFALRDVLPPTYPHMLAFPLQLSLMTDSSFPFRAIGLVHIANRITQHRPIRGSERLQIDVSATPVEDHPRGKQFSLLTEVRVGDELVWEEVSTNLKRGGGGGGGAVVGRAARPRDQTGRPRTPRPHRSRTFRRPPPGPSRATSAAATARCRATTTRSTSTP